MIITWFTDPSKGDFANNPNKFSSFYQYNTVTKEFVRIRLELGRNPQGDGGNTFAAYKAERFVGFSDVRLSSSSLDKWSVNDGKLCYEGHPLESFPDVASGVYDSSDVTRFVHRGNPVTTEPNLPPGISKSHLQLLANEVMLSEQDIVLVAHDATPAQLSASIKAELTQIMEKDIDQCSVDEIKDMLTEQSQILNEDTISRIIDEEISAIEEKILSQIDIGIPPTAAFEETFKNFRTAIKTAEDSCADGNFTEAFQVFENAGSVLETVISDEQEKMATWEQDEIAYSQTALETVSTVCQSQIEYERFLNGDITEQEYREFQENAEPVEEPPVEL